MKTAFIMGCLLAATTASKSNHKIHKKIHDVVSKVKKGGSKIVDIYDEVIEKYHAHKDKIAEATDKWAALNIDIDGENKEVYIAAPFWFTGGGGDKIEIPYGGRLFLSESYSLDPEKYFKPDRKMLSLVS